MATVTTGLRMQDQMTGVLRGVMQSVNLTVSAMEDMQNTSKRIVDTKAIKAAKQSIQQTEATINTLQSDIRRAAEQQEKFNHQIKRGQRSAEGLGTMIKRAVIALGGTMAIKGLVNMTDEYTSIQARLNLINDGQQTVNELNEKIYASANRSRGVYSDMANIVGKLGVTASKAFNSNDEMIAFSELMTKSFKVAGASAAEQTSAMYQLTQAMAAGRLQGDEFRSILENAPMLAQAIATEMNVSMGKLKELSSEGVITADVIKSALFSSAEQINEQFNNMPVTFSEAVNRMKNVFVEKMAPTFQRISNWINSPQGVQAINTIASALTGIVNILTPILLITLNIATFIQDNWSVIEPIIWGIVTALSYYLIMTKGVALATEVIGGASKAFRTLNTAMKANPALFIITSIIAVIAIMVRLWKTNDKVAEAMMRTWNAVLNFFDRIPAYFWQLIEWLSKPFQMWAKTVGKIYDAVINNIIKGINTVLKLINKVTGSSYEIQAKFSFENIADKTLEYAGVQKNIAYDKAAQKAAEREQKVLDMLASRKAAREGDPNKKTEDLLKQANGLSNTQLGLQNESNKKLGKLSDSVDVSNEDLKTMRELAEMKNIQNFVTLTPTVNVEANSTGGEGFDVDTVVARITNSLETEIASSASAVVMR